MSFAKRASVLSWSTVVSMMGNSPPVRWYGSDADWRPLDQEKNLGRVAIVMRSDGAHGQVLGLEVDIGWGRNKREQ